jgi:hypothetical protein
VTIGMVALAAAAGPRTASNDFCHRIIFAPAIVSLIIIFIPNGRASLKRVE